MQEKNEPTQDYIDDVIADIDLRHNISVMNQPIYDVSDMQHNTSEMHRHLHHVTDEVRHDWSWIHHHIHMHEYSDEIGGIHSMVRNISHHLPNGVYPKVGGAHPRGEGMHMHAQVTRLNRYFKFT